MSKETEIAIWEWVGHNITTCLIGAILSLLIWSNKQQTKEADLKAEKRSLEDRAYMSANFVPQPQFEAHLQRCDAIFSTFESIQTDVAVIKSRLDFSAHSTQPTTKP